MKLRNKWVLAAVLLVLLAALTTVAIAVTAGTDADPLVALSYLTGTYKQELLAEANRQITSQVADAEWTISSQLAELDDVVVQQPRSVSTGYERIALLPGESVSFGAGSEVLLLSGTIRIVSGSLTDSTAGVVLSSGGLTANHLCIGLTDGSLQVTEMAEIMLCR